MLANVSPFDVECPSCTGCSLHDNLQKAQIGEGSPPLRGSVYTQADGSVYTQADGSVYTQADGSVYTQADGSLRGTRFVLASLGLFLVPVLLALTGAIWVVSDWVISDWGMSDLNDQFWGATGGLLVGMIGTIVAARMLRTRSPEAQSPEGPSLKLLKGEAP